MIKVLCLAVFLVVPLAGLAVVHKRTSYFIDVEVNKKDIWIFCSDYNKNDVSNMSFRFLDEDKVYYFFYRGIRSVKQCQKEKNEYEKMMKDGDTVRVVGIRPDEEVTDSKYRYIKGIPERFTNVKKETSAYFVRLQVKDKCKAYFENDCELPKNYWAGMIPEK
jgi:hypothetical protein